ncbi:Spore maturation protein CgeB [Marininema mesophilum]|uniref:Spore maturation protein CgeB n=1 Tax=Marininema mesophilum TaxID=1048340 RepID=A0A1H2WI86_9BACL|nr:glycosyltransferase [Marininema mesophilum]SDW80218.1 Spore maturation protein CgeB [Marininema mesophilum]
MANKGQLKILCITNDRSQQMEKSSYYLMEELKNHCQLAMWTENGHIEKILAQLPFTPDFILLNDFLDPQMCPLIDGLGSIAIPKGMLFHDISYELDIRKRYARQNKIDYIFTHYRDAFLKWYPDISSNMFWLPHHVNTDVYKDYQLTKTIDYLMIGAMTPHIYPLRVIMLNAMKKNPQFVYHSHPGYTTVKNIVKGTLIGEDYAKEINRAKIFLTCNSVYEYTLLKYFEVMACKTLLLAPKNKETFDLGMKDGVHFVSINRENFYNRARFYLEHAKEREQIAENGFHLVRKFHTTRKRAMELVSQIKETLKNYL